MPNDPNNPWYYQEEEVEEKVMFIRGFSMINGGTIGSTTNQGTGGATTCVV